VSFVTHLYGTAAQMAARNPLVPKGVLAGESDTGVIKVGDGVTRYSSLSVALSSTYLTQAAATTTYAQKGTGTVMAPGPYRAGGSVFTTDLSNGTDTGGNMRSAHRDPYAQNVMEIGFSNWAANGAAGESTSATGTLTVRAAVEYPSGSYWPIRFRGQRDVTIEAGGFVTSDRVAVPGGIPANTVYWVHSYVTVSSGQKWPSSFTIDTASPWLEACSSGTSEVDNTLTAVTGTATKPYRPAFIRSVRSADTLRLLGVGDSIISAVGDTDPRRGWWGYLTDQAVSGIRLGCSAEKLTAFTVGGMQARLAYGTQGVNTAICALGVNDVAGGSNLATIQARMQTLWEFLYRQGIKVWQTTITPYSVTTTDSYATTANQTVHSSNAVRVTVNDWLRGLTPGSGGGQYLTGIVEHADCAESARNSGFWKVTGAANYGTSDGTHPSNAIHQLMSAAVPLSAMRTAAGVTG
jgi:lysophospholipase L1-like esterase